MKNNLTRLLLKLEKELKKANCPVLEYLNPGISKFEVDQLLKQFDLKLPTECYTLYAWKNGTGKTPKNIQTWILPLGMFSSIENSIEMYKVLAGKDAHWSKTMFMIFEGDGSGDWFLLECNKKSPYYGMLFFHSITNVDFDVIISMYDSIESFITTLIECFSEKAYYYEDNFLQIDQKKSIIISKCNNPQSDYWKKIAEYLEHIE